MSRKILIKNFGPVKTAEVDLDKNFQIFIGEQASGKSTIGKVVYFCRKIKDYTLDFLLEDDQFMLNHQNEYFINYLKYLTRKFMACFGRTKHMPYFDIQYTWGDNLISIRPNHDGYVRIRFDVMMRQGIQHLIRETADMYAQMDNYNSNSIIDNITAVGVMKRRLSKFVSEIFGDSDEVIYIPAGRSLLATLSEDLWGLSTEHMDLTMKEFISLIQRTRSNFGTKIPEMIKDYTKTVKGQINNAAVDQAYRLIREILKADYTSEEDGERIYFDERHWVKLMYGSSGQQEALWILLLSFILILENRRAFVIIEEPEAHLFPKAQKKIVNLIALLVNSTESRVILTTHSPYILTSANILLYSDKVEGNRKNVTDSVVPRSLRLSYDKASAYVVGTENKTIVSLMDEETHMIDTEYIDSVSGMTNEELERLLDMECES